MAALSDRDPRRKSCHIRSKPIRVSCSTPPQDGTGILPISARSRLQPFPERTRTFLEPHPEEHRSAMRLEGWPGAPFAASWLETAHRNSASALRERASSARTRTNQSILPARHAKLDCFVACAFRHDEANVT